MEPMGKTISTRWKEWAEKEPFWAYLCLSTFMGSIFCLGIHLAVLSGIWRTVGLCGLIGFGCCTEGMLWFRKQWWWLAFHTYVVVGVLGFEIASYFFGGN